MPRTKLWNSLKEKSKQNTEKYIILLQRAPKKTEVPENKNLLKKQIVWRLREFL